MTAMGDLPEDLVEEILSKVPMTSLRAIRSTCKKWNFLSKNRIFGYNKATAARKQYMGFMMMDARVCSMEFDLQGIRKDDNLVIDPSIIIKQVSGRLDQIEVSQVFHCDGSILCVVKDNTGLFVWNPYLGQTRWIQPRESYNRLDRYALGYDKNRNHKILRIFDLYPSRNRVFWYELYDFSSNSWRILDVKLEWDIQSHQRCVSFKGNTYFQAQKKKVGGGVKTTNIEDVLLCFDFTNERFGPPLSLPFNSYND
ncbi:PREDICTED: LOW QUALITY PROTEIN: F-box/kelch-repeat protein At3g13680-like [Camelina sativa]|uniref:LOW QUALITY PROTEIN: F-box/kelch-repeat protein At3g13680-like n=1 Tax=Camelina sativa TaxID=90675 RepID=A0ABM1RBI0_CAMSA|nr:PREDICTED: LOW QUALITY PROTEIN: F-box/kelch-repeat protein At3g13680-like [Camelina sativa]